ncbi:MAG TPA: hypothetical protein VFH73_20150 [Polyangia bacterium]|nr:hypothetical protein [Polyangia bacterium]
MASTLSGVAFAQVAPATPPVETAPAAGVVAAGGADLAAGFGVLGQLVVSDDIALSFIHQSQGNASGWNINVQPALDFFIAPNISVGGAIAIVHGSSSQSGVSGTDVTLIGIAARAGYALRLTEMLSLWARLSLGYAHTSFSLGSMSFSGYEIPLQIFAPILFHPVQHFFIGVGPIFSFQLANKVEGMSADKQTNIGLQSTIGGYWGK